MAFQGADVSALKGVAGACQKGAAAAGAVISILKKVIAALRASANGPWVEPFIRSLEALIKMLEMIVQRLNEFAKLLSMNATQQEQASALGSTAGGLGKSSVSPATPTNTESQKNVSAAAEAVKGLLDKFTESGKTQADTTQASTLPAAESSMSNPAGSSASNPAGDSAGNSVGNSAGDSGGSSGGNPNSSAPGGASPTGESVAQKENPRVVASSIGEGARTNYTAPTGGLSAGTPIPLESAGTGFDLRYAGVGAGIVGALSGVGAQLLRGKTNPGDTENK